MKSNLLSSFFSNASAAANLLALQTERTKLMNVTLPSAYHALGKDCVQQKRFLDCVPDLIKELRLILDEQKKLSDTTNKQNSTNNLSGKIVSAGKSVSGFAQQKKLGLERDSLLRKIGKSVFDINDKLSGPEELVVPIQNSLTRITEIDQNISRLSEFGKGQWITPKRLLLGSGIVVLLLMSIFASRLLLSNNSENQISQREAKARALHEQEFLKMLKAGDDAWDANNKGDAVQHYSQLLGQFCGHGQGDRTVVANIHKPEMARAAGRTIDFLAENGNDETAKDLIKKADQSDLVIVYTNPKVNRLVQAAKAEMKREEKEIDDWLRRESNSSNDNESGPIKNQRNGVTNRSSSTSNRPSLGKVPPSTGKAYISPHIKPNAGADEAVMQMRRAGTYTPQAEQNIREIFDNYDKISKGKK